MRLRIDLAYDGTDFHGWAAQPGLRTVQGELESALATVLHRGRCESVRDFAHLVVAGRTDAGVHASHQVCHLDLPAETLRSCLGHLNVSPQEALALRLGHMLDDDVSVRRVSVAPDGFDARFSALERTYVYRIADGGAFPDPRLRRFMLTVSGVLDVDAMNAAAACAVGLHDFGSFASPNPGGTTIREVKSTRWLRVPARPLLADGEGRGVAALGSGLVCFVIVADAYAHNMVRSLVNACIRVGLGRASLRWFRGKVAVPAREGATGPAPARGLTLEAVAYPPDDQLRSRALAIRARRTL